MVTFLVEAFTPASAGFSDIEARARAAADAMAKEGIAVAYIHSILVPGDEVCFHVFDGPSQEAVAEVGRRASLAFTRIVEALSASAKEV
jgi:hypothetical protein